MLLSIHAPAENARGSKYIESLLRTLYESRLSKQGIDLLIRTSHGETELAIDCPEAMRSLVTSQLQDSYPGTEIRSEQPNDHSYGETWSLALRIIPDVFTIRTAANFHDQELRQFADPIAGLLSAIRTGRSGRLTCTARLRVRPASRRRCDQAARIRWNANRRFPFSFLRRKYLQWATAPHLLTRLLARSLMVISRPQQRHHENGEETTSEQLFECWLDIETMVPASAAQIARKKLYEVAAAYGQFASDEVEFITGKPKRGGQRPSNRGFLLNAEEIATLWHPPSESVQGVARVHKPVFRELEPPIWLPSGNRHGDVTTLGRVQFRNQNDRIGMHVDDRLRSLFIVGKTGMGKSTLMLNMLSSDLAAGHGCGLIDPHGDLAEELLNRIPRQRTNDIVYFDAAADRPIGFNPLHVREGSQPTLVADGVLSAFKKVFGFEESSAPRLLHIFRNCLLTLVEMPESTLISVQQLLHNSSYRKSAIGRITNPAVRDFWINEYGKWNDRDRTQYIASLQNKLGAFLSNPSLQAILGQPHGPLDLRRIMDTGQVLIVNLSKGRLGEDASALLGALLVSNLQLAAMSRADLPEPDRREFFGYVDEFQNFATESFATILSEARKYRLSLTLANQYLAQIEEATLQAVIGNVGSMVSFQVGADDAEFLATQMGRGLTQEDLMNIPRYHAYVRLLLNGMPTRPFSMVTQRPATVKPNRGNTIRRVSAQRYGRPRQEIEERVAAQYRV